MPFIMAFVTFLKFALIKPLLPNILEKTPCIKLLLKFYL